LGETVEARDSGEQLDPWQNRTQELAETSVVLAQS